MFLGTFKIKNNTLLKDLINVEADTVYLIQNQGVEAIKLSDTDKDEGILIKYLNNCKYKKGSGDLNIYTDKETSIAIWKQEY